MPFYKIGEQAEPIAPATQMDQPRVSRQEIEDWFNNTILALQDDPYVHMDPDQEDYSELFRVLNTETNSADSILAGSTSIREYDFMQKELLFEKSLAGQLFYYDPTLDEYGGFRQLYTKQVMVDGKQDYKLFITDDLKALPKTEPTKPQHPGMWKYLFYPFFAGQFKEYKAQMKEYDAQMAKYAKITEMENSLADEKYRLGEYVDERTTGRENTTFVYARDIQAEKLEAYERTKPVEQKEVVNPVAENAVDQPNKVAGEVAARNVEEAPKQKAKTQPEKSKSVLQGEDKTALERFFDRISIPEKYLPENSPIKLNGKTAGVLRAMALGSKEVTVKVNAAGERMANDPDLNYKRILCDHYMLGKDQHKGDAAFLQSSWKTLNRALNEASENGDYSKLGKLIADGLTQNNKMLQAQERLTDIYSAYAAMGGVVLDILKNNPQLEQAVKDQLGPDSKQLDMAKAARNISNLRAEVMPIYEHMLEQYGQTVKYERRNPSTGEMEVAEKIAVNGSIRDMAKVTQLFNIDVAMMMGEFKLEGSEYAKDGAVEIYTDELNKSDVLNDFLKSPDRVKTLQDPMKMKKLYIDAVADRKKQIAQQSNQKEQEKEIENQPKEKSSEVSMV